jgi:hypothetical protein
MFDSEFLISEETLKAAIAYKEKIKNQGIKIAGERLSAILAKQAKPVDKIGIEEFLSCLIQSKQPQIFAESQIYHDKRDWTPEEVAILGDITVNMQVQMFNDGNHRARTAYQHEKPIEGILAYIPGALLRADTGGVSADFTEVVQEGVIDQEAFNKLYERRLLPQLLRINLQAADARKKAVITIPGIGTGQFAGSFQGPEIKKAFRIALESILEAHQYELSAIDIVHYDPFSGDVKADKTFGGIQFKVRPLTSNDETSAQLAYPEGCSADTHLLASFVAWDHFSYPGNDFWGGSRATDDGVKGASTDTMYKVTGIHGKYNARLAAYMPEAKATTWAEVAAANQIKLDAPIYVMSDHVLYDVQPLGRVARRLMTETAMGSRPKENMRSHPQYINGLTLEDAKACHKNLLRLMHSLDKNLSTKWGIRAYGKKQADISQLYNAISELDISSDTFTEENIAELKSLGQSLISCVSTPRKALFFTSRPGQTSSASFLASKLLDDGSEKLKALLIGLPEAQTKAEMLNRFVEIHAQKVDSAESVLKAEAAYRVVDIYR